MAFPLLSKFREFIVFVPCASDNGWNSSKKLSVSGLYSLNFFFFFVFNQSSSLSPQSMYIVSCALRLMQWFKSRDKRNNLRMSSFRCWCFSTQSRTYLTYANIWLWSHLIALLQIWSRLRCVLLKVWTILVQASMYLSAVSDGSVGIE